MSEGYIRQEVRSFYTRKNAQVVPDLQTSCNKVVVKPIQDVFALLVPSCCDKSGTSCYQSFYKVDDGNRLATSCSNKTNTGCL